MQTIIAGIVGEQSWEDGFKRKDVRSAYLWVMKEIEYATKVLNQKIETSNTYRSSDKIRIVAHTKSMSEIHKNTLKKAFEAVIEE